MDRMGEGQLFRYLSSGSWKKLWRSGISGTKTLFLLLEMVSDFEDYLWNTLNMQVLPSSPRFLSIPLYLPETSVACTFCVEPLVRSWGHEMQTAQGTHDLWAEPEDSVEDLTQSQQPVGREAQHAASPSPALTLPRSHSQLSKITSLASHSGWLMIQDGVTWADTDSLVPSWKLGLMGRP